MVLLMVQLSYSDCSSLNRRHGSRRADASYLGFQWNVAPLRCRKGVLVVEKCTNDGEATSVGGIGASGGSRCDTAADVGLENAGRVRQFLRCDGVSFRQLSRQLIGVVYADVWPMQCDIDGGSGATCRDYDVEVIAYVRDWRRRGGPLGAKRDKPLGDGLLCVAPEGRAWRRVVEGVRFSGCR